MPALPRRRWRRTSPPPRRRPRRAEAAGCVPARTRPGPRGSHRTANGRAATPGRPTAPALRPATIAATPSAAARRRAGRTRPTPRRRGPARRPPRGRAGTTASARTGLVRKGSPSLPPHAGFLSGSAERARQSRDRRRATSSAAGTTSTARTRRGPRGPDEQAGGRARPRPASPPPAHLACGTTLPTRQAHGEELSCSGPGLGPGCPSDRPGGDRMPSTCRCLLGARAPPRWSHPADLRGGADIPRPAGPGTRPTEPVLLRRSWPAGKRCGALVRRASLRWTSGNLVLPAGYLSTPGLTCADAASSQVSGLIDDLQSPREILRKY